MLLIIIITLTPNDEGKKMVAMFSLYQLNQIDP